MKMNKMNKIENMEQYYDIIEENEKVIIYWNTLICPDCFVSRRFMPELITDFKDFNFYKIEKNSNLELAKHLNIYGVPSFLIFVNNEEIGRFVNKKRKSYQEVKDFIIKTIS